MTQLLGDIISVEQVCVLIISHLVTAAVDTFCAICKVIREIGTVTINYDLECEGVEGLWVKLFGTDILQNITSAHSCLERTL